MYSDAACELTGNENELDVNEHMNEKNESS